MLYSSIMQSSEQRKSPFPGDKEGTTTPFWTPQLEQLQEAVTRARKDMENNPPDQDTAKYSKARAEFTREKLLQTRKQWYEKTASLNLEKDSSKLWSLTKVLNEEAPSCSKTVLRVHNMLLTDKKAANEFAKLYRRESTLPLTPKKVGDMKEKLKQEEKQKNVPSPCLTLFIPSNFRGINLSGPSNFQCWGRKTGAPTK